MKQIKSLQGRTNTDIKDLSKTTATTDSEEVAGILMAISVVAKRLAKNVAKLDVEKHQRNEDVENAT